MRPHVVLTFRFLFDAYTLLYSKGCVHLCSWDKAPRPSISNVIWILLSATVGSTNYFEIVGRQCCLFKAMQKAWKSSFCPRESIYGICCNAAQKSNNKHLQEVLQQHRLRKKSHNRCKPGCIHPYTAANISPSPPTPLLWTPPRRCGSPMLTAIYVALL